MKTLAVLCSLTLVACTSNKSPLIIRDPCADFVTNFAPNRSPKRVRTNGQLLLEVPFTPAAGYHGHLSFDNYDQDQVMVIEEDQDEEGKSSFIRIMDRPDYSLEPLMQLMEKNRDLAKEKQRTALMGFYEEPTTAAAAAAVATAGLRLALP